MPTRKVNPVEAHFEKGIVGIAAVVLLYTLFAYTLSSPIRVMIGNESVGPGRAYALVREEAEKIDGTASVQAAQWPAFNPPPAKAPRTVTGLPPDLGKALPAVVWVNPELPPDA